MTPSTGKQIITTHVSWNISISKGNHAINCFQFRKYNMINDAENEAEKLVPDLQSFKRGKS